MEETAWTASLRRKVGENQAVLILWLAKLGESRARCLGDRKRRASQSRGGWLWPSVHPSLHPPIHSSHGVHGSGAVCTDKASPQANVLRCRGLGNQGLGSPRCGSGPDPACDGGSFPSSVSGAQPALLRVPEAATMTAHDHGGQDQTHLGLLRKQALCLPSAARRPHGPH